MRTVSLFLALLCLSDTIGSAVSMKTPPTTGGSSSDTNSPLKEDSPPKRNLQRNVNFPKHGTKDYAAPIKVEVTIEDSAYPIYFGELEIAESEGLPHLLTLDTMQPGKRAKVLPPSQETQELMFNNFKAPASLPTITTNPMSINDEVKGKKISITVDICVPFHRYIITLGKGKKEYSVAVEYVQHKFQ